MGLIQHNANWIVSQNSMLQDCKSEQQLYDKIIFIETQSLNRPQLNLQTVHIYRLKQAPYQSFLKTQRTFQYESPKLIQFSSTLTKLSQQIIHKNLAPVQFIKINEENEMCLRTVKIDYYATYYGIELRDVIENRKNQDCRFQQGQILYVAKSLINFGAYLQSHKIAFGMYKTKNIFMSDNGYVKMYLFHMLPENKHINYYNLLSSPRVSNLSLNLPIAPEMFQDLQQNNFSPSFDFYKADLFEIGMILVDMMVESSLQRYYRFGKQGMSFDENKLHKDLKELKQKGVYHFKILYFLQNILQPDPKTRWTFQQADKYLDQLKKQCEFAYRLNLRNQPFEQDESQTLKNKLSFKSQQPESQYVLRSIQNSLQSKLNPLPLKSLSKNSTKHSTQLPNYFHKTQYPSKQTSTQKSIYTKRRNTGVSIISSSSQQNDRSFSRKDQKCSKFTTLRNSQAYEHALRSQKNQKQQLTDFADKMSCISSNVNLNLIQTNNKLKQKQSENWLTLGSTRITEENSRAFNLLPPKSTKSLRPNLKIHLHHNPKQNMQTITKRQPTSSSISTHIKVHKKMTMSPKSKQSQLKVSKMEFKEEWKQNIPNWKQQRQKSQKSLVAVRPKLKINNLLRG